MRLAGTFVVFAGLVLAPAVARAQSTKKVDACSLLIPSEASTALEVPVEAGHHVFPTTTDQCFWSDVATLDPEHRRVTVSIISQPLFDGAKTSSRRKSEAVSGVGDDAAYVYPGGTPDPWIYVKKGNVYFIVRVLNGLKAKPPLKPDAVKAKESVLAKAATGRV